MAILAVAITRTQRPVQGILCQAWLQRGHFARDQYRCAYHGRVREPLVGIFAVQQDPSSATQSSKCTSTRAAAKCTTPAVCATAAVRSTDCTWTTVATTIASAARATGAVRI